VRKSTIRRNASRFTFPIAHPSNQRNKVKLAFIAIAFSAVAFGQHIVVTAEGHHGAPPPDVNRDRISAEVDRHPAKVESWTPLRGDQASLELYILIDDGVDSEIGLQFDSLKAFINSQPATTKIGLAYLRNGSANIVAPLTAEHDKIAKALRLPSGPPGIASSPYMCISDLVKKWPAADGRREVLLISSGVDPWVPADPQNPYLQQAIAAAQGAGILVHSIYYAQAGHSGHSFWQINWGQNYLSQLGDETGGEAYWQGSINPVTFDPFLKDLTQRLQNQYLLTLEPREGKGALEPFRITSSESGVSLQASSKINFQSASTSAARF
jgi:hypothetical protein